MQIKLELDDYRFTTTHDNFPIGLYGPTERRWLIVMVGGKQFVAQRQVEQARIMYRRDVRDEIDKALIETMQLMLESILLNAAAKVPDGAIETEIIPLRQGARAENYGGFTTKQDVRVSWKGG